MVSNLLSRIRYLLNGPLNFTTMMDVGESFRPSRLSCLVLELGEVSYRVSTDIAGLRFMTTNMWPPVPMRVSLLNIVRIFLLHRSTWQLMTGPLLKAPSTWLSARCAWAMDE